MSEGMAYTRAEDVQVDAWQDLGNEDGPGRHCFPTISRASDCRFQMNRKSAPAHLTSSTPWFSRTTKGWMDF